MGEVKDAVLATEVPTADTEKVILEKTDPVLDHNSIGLFKDPKDGMWKVAVVKYNLAGQTGGFDIIHQTGFRAEAMESFKINAVKLGLFG